MRVSDLLSDYAHPAGDQGRDVPLERINVLIAEMRGLMEAIYRWNCVVDQNELLACWEYLNAMERAGWSKVVQARGRYVAE